MKAMPVRFVYWVLICAALGQTLWAQPEDYNRRGVDPRVDYNQLYRNTVPIGIPWDDRNLGLTAEDLAKLPSGDFEDVQNVPVWFRVMLRGQYPQMLRSGEAQYPRSAAEVYHLFWGGQFLTEKAKQGGGSLVVNGEVNITGTRNSAESAISINPVDSDLVISGVNGPSGQEMYFSSDAGLTWTRSTSNLGSSCCDPTVGWSPDGTIAYMTQLGTCSNLCNIEFYTSMDNGQTWGNKITVKGGGTNDKEYLHVDHHPSSPFLGNIYLHWHSFNTIEFARSTDNGQTWETPITFGGTTGIGGDISTDTSGKIYHIWPRTAGGLIRMNTSTDGGQTFSSITQVADTNAGFDYPIPAFDNRRAFIYVSTAVDLSNGPFQDRVYACWNDTNGPESAVAANNHSKIVVAFSANGGANWTEVSPHSLADIDDVDRFNPWLDVDELGNVHVAYASTQNDPNRRNVDIYHTHSSDGGNTWSNPQRVTAVTSNYIPGNFQWGDYNGMSVLDGKVRPIWTDNRTAVRVFTADADFSGGVGDFSLASGNNAQTVCQGGTAPTILVDVAAIGGFGNSVSFSFNPPLPAGFTGNITGSPLTPPGQVSVDIESDGTSPEGLTQIQLRGEGGAVTHDITLGITVLTKSIAQAADLWQNPPNFDGGYDLVVDGIIDTQDLVSYLNDCLTP